MILKYLNTEINIDLYLKYWQQTNMVLASPPVGTQA